MPRNVYAIRDRVAQDIVTMQMYSLLTFKTDQQAIRYFADSLLDPKSFLAQHPSDYDLVLCGRVEDDGALKQMSTPEVIITGDALVSAQTPKLET